jgi:hypothetical protein
MQLYQAPLYEKTVLSQGGEQGERELVVSATARKTHA